MGLKSLSIEHFRNLHSVKINTDAGLILFTGQNAAGKTSLLEAIFYLSYGRSFRTHQLRHLIQYDREFFRIVSELDKDTSRIGLERSLKSQVTRINQQNVTRLSDLSLHLPVLALHPDSHQLISEGPEFRRQFLDWGVFHVEQQFMPLWKTYKTALSQRNAALKAKQSQRMCSLWDKQLTEAAMQINQLRLAYLQDLVSVIDELKDSLFPGQEISLRFKRGWSEDHELSLQLTQQFSSDHDKGYTQSGPHRADVKILVDGQPAQSAISRGQQKRLVCLLKIAQLIVFSRSTDQRPVLLFDDLPAELDQINQDKILNLLSTLDVQVFITAITPDQINLDYWKEYKVFHVEQGQVKPRLEESVG